MKKILISVSIIILIMLLYLILVNSISLGGFKVDSISDIKSSSDNLNAKFDEAIALSVQTYGSEVGKLESAINSLKDIKETYSNKTKNIKGKVDLTQTQIETYKIEFLWTTIGNYAKEKGVILTLDLREGSGTDVYDLDFTLLGKYVGITSFIYDLENDSRLNFKIDNFVIAPGGTLKARQQENVEETTGKVEETSNEATNTIEQNTNTESNASVAAEPGDTTNLSCAFTVTGIGITLE